MRIKYKNLIIDYNNESNSNYSGETIFDLQRKDLQKFFTYMDECLEYCQEEVEEFLDNPENQEYQSDGVDLLIIFMDWVFTEETEDIEITYYGKKFWLFHDIGHAENDVYGGIITPSGICENNANKFSIEKLKEYEFEIDLSYDEIVQFKEEFYKRFKEPMCFDESILYATPYEE